MHKRGLAIRRTVTARFALWLCLLSLLLQPATMAMAQATDTPTLDDSSPAAVATQRVFLPLVTNATATGDTTATVVLQSETQEPTPTQAPVSEADHQQDDYALAELARQRNEPPFVVPATAAATGPLNVVGRWDAPVTWPFVFASAASLPDGRIIAWGGNNTTSFNGGTNTYSSIWEPATGQFVARNLTNHSAFCAIPTMLEDGRVFLNGGDGTRERTSTFDWRTNTWTRIQDMSTGRWYNGAVALPNGKVFTMMGDPGGPYPEIWTPNLGWSLLTGANLNNGVLNYTGYQSTWLPYLHLAPSGMLFHSGPTPQMNWLDPTGNGSITNAGLTNTWYPKYASSIMYDQGKILVAGGAASNSSTAPGTNQAMVIDLNGATPTKTVITPMSYARKFNNAVVMPTGEVMIVGGNTSGVEFSDSGTILTPEIWNPDTRAWRPVADLSVPRNYHSVALLMTDGRIWSGGGGLCACAADHPDHQIYWPPYLFNADGSLATRPVISSAPTSITYGNTFSVQATAGMANFSLIKLSGITHNLNSDLRYLKLPFTTPTSGQYQLTVPSNPNVLTPGYWMLFAINSQGVPSVSKVIQVTSTPAQPSPGSFRYVKLEALSEVSGNPWSSVAEFNVLDSSGAPLSRTGWTAVADSQETQGENGAAGNAIDGNTATIWHTQWQAASPAHPHWLVVDLGGNYTIGGFRYLPRQDMANGRIANYKFYLSTDGVNWGNAVTQGTFPSTTAEQTVTLNALSVNAIVSPPKPVNTAIAYTASVNNGLNPRFKWLFGDGTAETAYATSATASHAFAQPGVYVVKVTVIDDRGIEQSTTFAQAIHLPSTPNRPVASMNLAYETRTNANNRLWVVNQDNDSVSLFDVVTNAKVAEINVGSKPRSIAVAPNGRIWVTNKGASTISIIDPGTLAVVQTVTLTYGAQPFGLAFAPTGGVGYVALEGAGKLLRFDAATAAQTGSVDVGMNVRHLSINSAGSKIYVSRFITPRLTGEETATPQMSSGGGEIVVVNAATLTVNKTMLLRSSDKPDTEVQGRGIPNYLGPLVLSPDGVNGWTPSKQDNLQRGIQRDGNNLTFQNTVRAISSRIDLTTDTEDYAARIDHDNAGVASTALFDKYGAYLFVALETNREVAVVDGYFRRDLFRIPVGLAPQGLALSPDGLTLYVNNFTARTVTVLDISKLINESKNTVTTVATYNSVATEKLAANVLKGKQLFYDAKDTRLALDSYISCAACHNDGGQDGRVWDLTGFGEGLRNTIGLNGHAGTGQGFLHWSANFDEVQDFEGQIRNLAGGTGLMTDAQFNTGTRNQPLGDPKAGVSTDLDALAAYVTSLNSVSASPFRNPDGTLTTDGAAGKTLFQSQNCAQCHGGANFTNSGAANPQVIGTIKPTSGGRLGGALTGIDIPTLRDLWATGPYLHDGSATTLSAAVRAHNNVTIIDADLVKLAAYLQQIDAAEAGPANPPPTVSLTAPTTGATFAQGTAITLNATASDTNGTITKVEFYAGTTLLNTDTTAPYSFTWSGAAPGSYTLTAKAYDNQGATATSTTVAISVTASGGSGAGLTAHYFNTINLDGAPTLQRTEAINFAWGAASPGSGVTTDNFSVRWQGQVEAPVTGAYQFQTVSDDGIRLWVNGAQLINNWTDHGDTTNTSGVVNLTAGVKYTVLLEFYEKGGSATAKLLWQLPTTTAFVTVPADRLYAVTNLAQGKASSQSSTANGGLASRAVDGNTNGAWSANSVTHTSNSANAWWQVNLGNTYALNSIVLWNRTDCCANRLSNFYVFVSTSDMTGRSFSSLVNDTTVWRYRLTGQAPAKLHIPANVNGRYVRVQLAGTNYLSLAEVQVFGR